MFDFKVPELSTKLGELESELVDLIKIRKVSKMAVGEALTYTNLWC